MKINVIDNEFRSVSEQLAINESCFNSVKSGELSEIFRIYRFSPGVILSKYQDSSDLHSNPQVKVTRRKTGGGAVYVDENMLGYSLFTRKSSNLPSASIPTHTPYQRLTAAVQKVLKDHGVQASLVDHWGLEVNNCMIAGHAQRYEKSTFEVHGLLSINCHDMSALESAIKLRKQVATKGGSYLIMDGIVYDSNWNVFENDLYGVSVVCDEFAQLSKGTSLSTLGVDLASFSKSLVRAISKTDIYCELPSKILSSAQSYLADYQTINPPSGVIKRGLGHCFVDMGWNK